MARISSMSFCFSGGLDATCCFGGLGHMRLGAGREEKIGEVRPSSETKVEASLLAGPVLHRKDEKDRPAEDPSLLGSATPGGQQQPESGDDGGAHEEKDDCHTSEQVTATETVEPAPEPGIGTEALSTEVAPKGRDGDRPDMGRALLELLRKGPQQPQEPRLRSATGCSTLSTSSGAAGRNSSDSSLDSSSETQDQHDMEQPPLPPVFAGPLAELWDPLVRPILDSRHPKAFVGHTTFSGGGAGFARTPVGPRPQVLVDYRDEHGIIAMFKPSGWATCSTPQWEGNEGNLIRYVWQYFNAPSASPCHRLDKGTSGIVMLATNKTAGKHVCQQILHKTLVKQYVGLCHGFVTPGTGAFSAPLALSSADRPLGVCSTEGREAVTRFRVLGYFRSRRGEYSLVQVQIDHGRQHQIRLHMASLGHPIVNDMRYNASKAKEDAEFCPRLFLHACFLSCTLPPTGSSKDPEPFAVACHLPPELKCVLTSELEMQRELSSDLSDDAKQLCECLLSPQVSTVATNRFARRQRQSREDLEELHASRLALRRRDEFMQRFGFNAEQRVQVTQIVNKLPTSKDRSAALQSFRVLGQRTPDFIVARFSKYVEGLLRWHQTCKEDVEESCEPPAIEGGEESTRPSTTLELQPASEVEEEPCAECLKQLLPNLSRARHDGLPQQARGPLRILTENVWCSVCKLEEKQVSLISPFLCLRVRQPGVHGTRPPRQPVRRRRNAKEVRRWAPAGKGCGKGTIEDEDDEEEEDDEDEDLETEEEDQSEEEDEDDGENEEEEEDWEEDWVEEPAFVSKRAVRRWKPSNNDAIEPAVSSKSRSQKAKELEKTVRELVAGQGGSVNGVWLAGKVAESFNQHVRENHKRNDGALKRWLCSIAGIAVEQDAKIKNQWRVRTV
eukprot:TRINITY_DN18616_c0_g1_i1.p1 TRINITY_DN18616_c0_g1~~TRINITY_DN18616_c0_g1_i1.p1  ORF type:complete len:920 (-),score=203.89 TRINITY_DN18616_c0_g1_i1:253-2946(-)